MEKVRALIQLFALFFITADARAHFKSINSMNLVVTDHDLDAAINFASNSVEKLKRLEDNLRNSHIGVILGEPSHGQLIDSYPSQHSSELGKIAQIVNKASSYLLQSSCKKQHVPTADCLEVMQHWSLNKTQVGKKCYSMYNAKNAKCSNKLMYRNVEGFCNNLKHPSWGQAETPYLRLIPSKYDDGIMVPRKSVSKSPLPSPRDISSLLIHDVDAPDDSTLALSQWTQFIANDLFHTSVSPMNHVGTFIECCRPNHKMLSPRHRHPLCMPIEVSRKDPDYSKFDVSCMNYVRSQTSLRKECNFGPADQMNLATHFLDGSHIYKKSPGQLAKYQTDGVIKTVGSGDDQFLESTKPFMCLTVPLDDMQCYDSGDSRVNQHPQQAIMYTLWTREHNRLVKALHNINPEWDYPRLFEEARRIVVAQIQHITYAAWVPLMLGQGYTSKMKLQVKRKGLSSTFSEETDPRISNSFATAGLSFVYSTLQSTIGLYNEERELTENITLRELFYTPYTISSPGVFDSLVRGLASQPSQKIDASFTKDVTFYLFAGKKIFGQDIMSLDIQRGRDHGLPGYTQYRKFCDLPTGSTFDTFTKDIPEEMMEKLKSIYKSPDDIDLIIGATLETVRDDGKLPPTLKCIVGEQMLRTRIGDAYFYDSAGVRNPFTEGQINELKKSSLARIFCDNEPNVLTMQPDVFALPSASNPIIDCKNAKIPQLNLNLWKNAKKPKTLYL